MNTFPFENSKDIKIGDKETIFVNKEENEKNKSNDKRKLEAKPIDIHVDLTSLQKELDNPRYSADTFTDFKNAINKVKDTLNKLVNVNCPRSSLKADISKLHSFKFNDGDYDSSLNSEISSDLLVLIRFWKSDDDWPESKENIYIKPKIIETQSAGSACNGNQPKVGIIIIGNKFMNSVYNKIKNKSEYLKYLFLHEFTHLLGFIDEYISPSSNSNIRFIRKTKPFITHSKVIEHAKEYFGCPTLSKLELEEGENFEGLQNSHWESRLLLGEYMTSEPYFGDQVISEFTLRLLDSLGYYTTNDYTGGLMKFGKGKGCEFIEKDCFDEKNYFAPSSKYEFCDLTGQQFYNRQSCSSGRQSRTYCLYQDEQNIDDYSREDMYAYGRRKEAEYCATSETPTLDRDRIDENDYVGNCRYENDIGYGKKTYKDYTSKNFDESVGEIMGENSFCAISSLIRNGDAANFYKDKIRATCYPMHCSTQSLTIKINKQYVVCPREGGLVEVNNYSGYLYCPKYDIICSGSVLCNNMFDCVEKGSEPKKDLGWIKPSDAINEKFSFIFGEAENKNLNNFPISVGYELSEDNDTACPLNCKQCFEYRRCFNCTTEFYKGKLEDNLKGPIECISDKPDTIFYHYLHKNYNLNGIILDIYFDCMEGCGSCDDKDTCKACFSNFTFVNKVCKETIPGCGIYDKINGVDYNSPGNLDNTYYTECEKCKEDMGYFCIKLDDGEDDKKHCYPIGKDIADQRYFQDGKCYQKCDAKYPHCEICTKDICLNCTKRYHFPNDDHSVCKLDRGNITENKCIFTIDYNTLANKPLEEVNIEDMVDDYLMNYPSYIQNVTHYVNEEKNYTITFFIEASCTKELLKEEYFGINDAALTAKIRTSLMSHFQINDPTERTVSVFIAYGDKNYYYRLFSLETKEVILAELPQYKDLKINIENNFAKIIRKKLGYIVVDLIKGEELDIFSEDKGALKEFCKNVTLLGIDIPLNKRKNYLYVHKFKNAYLCRSEICNPTNIKLKETTSECVCPQIYTKHYNDPYEEFTFYSESNKDKRSAAKDAFSIFNCVEETFDSKHFKSNFGFFISLICIILQIILFLLFILVGKPINFASKTTSSPPKKVYLRVNADWIKTQGANLNNHDEEKDIQSKDEIEDEFVIEEFNYNIDKHESSSYSVDTDLAKKQEEVNKLKEKPDGKGKNTLTLLPDKSDDESGKDDDLEPIEKEKRLEQKGFLRIYWIVLSLKQHIINYFSCIKCLKITESFVPVYIMGIRSLLMIVLVFFVNAICLTQNYFDKKFEYFNKKYNMIPAQKEIKISVGERLNYGFGHTVVNSLIAMAIYFVVQLIFGLLVFSVRKEITELFVSKDVLKINSLAKTMKAKYIIFFVINILFMIAFFMFLANFNGVYAGSGTDFGAGGFLSLLWIEIIPFIWSLIIALVRYLGISKQNKTLYDISQIFMF